MCKKHRRVFQDHVKYIHNDIVKPSRVVILQYTKRVHDIHYIVKYLPPPSMKVVIFSQLVGKSTPFFLANTLFEFQLRMEYPHPCRMSWRIIMRNIVPYFMNNYVTFCKLLRLSTIGKGL